MIQPVLLSCVSGLLQERVRDLSPGHLLGLVVPLVLELHRPVDHGLAAALSARRLQEVTLNAR